MVGKIWRNDFHTVPWISYIVTVRVQGSVFSLFGCEQTIDLNAMVRVRSESKILPNDSKQLPFSTLRLQEPWVIGKHCIKERNTCLLILFSASKLPHDISCIHHSRMVYFHMHKQNKPGRFVLQRLEETIHRCNHFNLSKPSGTMGRRTGEIS